MTCFCAFQESFFFSKLVRKAVTWTAVQTSSLGVCPQVKTAFNRKYISSQQDNPCSEQLLHFYGNFLSNKDKLRTFFSIFLLKNEKFVFSIQINNHNKCNNCFTTSHEDWNQVRRLWSDIKNSMRNLGALKRYERNLICFHKKLFYCKISVQLLKPTQPECQSENWTHWRRFVDR